MPDYVRIAQSCAVIYAFEYVCCFYNSKLRAVFCCFIDTVNNHELSVIKLFTFGVASSDQTFNFFALESFVLRLVVVLLKEELATLSIKLRLMWKGSAKRFLLVFNFFIALVDRAKTTVPTLQVCTRSIHC